MNKKILILLIFFTAAFAEVQREIIFETNEATDRIVLPNEIIDANSIEIMTEKFLPNWRFASENNTIYFSENISANQKINIKYSALHSGILKTYGLNLPKFSEADGGAVHFENNIATGDGSADISFEGTKTIGVSIGSNGEVMMEQSLYVEIFGYIDSVTKISAHINDQSSSLDGQTSEIGELDRIYLKVENPRWSAIAGDLEIRSIQNGILREFYTPKGIFAELKNDNIGRNNSAFAGISGTKSGYNRFVGVSGIQNGRFNLQPNRNTAVVQIISGSVRVLIDGVLQTENENYVVDYELANVRFTAKTPILREQIIEIHYKYRDFDYNSFSTGTQHRFSLLDSTLNFDFSFFFTKDIFESGEREWTQEEISKIKNAGNQSPKFLLGNKIHRNDVLRVQAFRRLYSLDENGKYRWESDPETVYLQKDLYAVNFQFAERDSGEYLPVLLHYYNELLKHFRRDYLDSIRAFSQNSVLGDVYLYVGKGNGYYSAYGEIILPSQSVKSEVSINYEPSEQLAFNITIAGENFDVNTMSEIDDGNNNFAGFKTDLFISSNPDRNFLVKDRFSSANAGELFVDNILDKRELEHKWGISPQVSSYSLWENMFYGGFHRYFLLKSGYGRSNSTTDFVSQRISGGIESGREISFGFDYLFAKRIVEQGSGAGSDGRQQNADISFDLGRFDLNFGAEESWYKNNFIRDFESYQYYTGEFASGVSAENKDKNLSGLVRFRQFNRSNHSDKHILADKIFRDILISASTDRETSENHRIKADGSIIIRDEKTGKGTDFLLSLYDQIYSSDFSKGLNTKWNLGVETRSESRWEYIKVPDGTGTHIKDPITGNFVVFPFGDYVAREIWVHDGLYNRRFTANDFEIFWYKNMRNIRLSGSFEANSKMEASDKWYQYLPVLPNFHEELRDDALYSGVFYNQFLSFLPAQIPEISYDLRLGTGKSIDNSNFRQYFDGRHNFLYRWERFHLGLENKGFVERKKNESGFNNYNFLIKDMSFKPLQNFVLLNWLHLFLEEMGGLTSNNEVSGTYAGIRPGVKFLPRNAGSAEISYNYARVNFDGELFFNMADGFAKDDNHRISATLGIRANDKLRFFGFVRGDKNQKTADDWRFSASLNMEIMIK